MRRNILGSHVFQQVLVACARFTVAALALLWIGAGIGLWLILASQDAVIEEELAYFGELHAAGGTAAVKAELSDEDGSEWSEDSLFYFLEEGELFLAFRDQNYEIIAGYPGLHAEDEIGEAVLDHPEIETAVRGVTVDLGEDGEILTVGGFFPSAWFDLTGFTWFGSFALVLIVLPLAVITGYMLSRRVLERIDGLSQTAASVAAGQMASRVTLSGRDDEFDRLGRGINRMLDEVASLAANIESVSVGVAHDLRTPLGNLGGRLELIARDAADPAAVAAHLEQAEGHLAQVLRIFDAMLRLGEIEAGRRRAAFAPVDISALVGDMGAAYAAVLEDADKSLACRVAPGVTVDGDAELLQQLLANLLENAAEHSRDAARVTLDLTRDADRAVLTVADDGPGIAAPDRARIFDRFYRADASRTSGGNGLGLSLVKAIADLHGAELTLDEETLGASFSVVFQTTE